MLASCVKPPQPKLYDDIRGRKGNVLISNEGLFQWNQAELTLYNKWDHTLTQNCFYLYNKKKTGDVLQRIYAYKQLLYLIVNNSGNIEIMDQDSLKSIYSWKGFRSPRHIAFYNETRAFVSDLYAGGIYMVNPNSRQIESIIPVSSWTEHMLVKNNFIYVSAPKSNKLYKINADLGQVADSLITMKGGNTLLLDRNGMIWQACMGDSLNHIPGGLVCIDPVTFEVKSVWNTPGSVSSLCMNSARDRLFFLSKDVYTTEISVIRPACIFNSQGRQFYGLDYDPELDELYVANARDFVSHGMAYRLKAGSGLMVDSFDTGIIPNGFYFLP